MKPNYYKIIQECVERGIDSGYQRAFKHSDTPSEEVIKEEIERYVMLNICDYFDFNNSTEN